MEMHVRSTGEGNREACDPHSYRVAKRVGRQITMRHVTAMTFALALGFAMGLVFRGSENLGFLEWVMMLLAISAIAVGYYIRGIEFDGDDAQPLPRSDERSNVPRLASRHSRVPVSGSGSSRDRRSSVSHPIRASH
jgi:hypothetical protein